MSGKTLFDKIWDAHVVSQIEDGPSVFYIDKHIVHEVTSPQAFAGLDQRGITVLKPEDTIATPDHNVPTENQHLPIEDELSRLQVNRLTENTQRHSVQLFGLNDPNQGVVHVVGPEQGITQPGFTIVCGDSHTATHGAFGCVAFGIGTSEVEMVLATQCILQPKPKKMKISVEGKLQKGVTAKDLILYIISKLSTSGGTGYFIEYAGAAFEQLSMEGRMTVCNMSIECGARGGMIAPDEKTFAYLKGRRYAPKGEKWDEAVKTWKTLKSDEDAVFDKEYHFDAADIAPMITYGTNPGMGISITGNIPELSEIDESTKASFKKSLEYMGYQPGEKMLDKKIDYVFVGSCTNGRIEDLRDFARFVEGKQKHPDIVAWIVPGSKIVEKQANEEGITKKLEEAGFELRQPGCSACLAMNDDKVPAGKYAVATSNRNFEGRQGPGSRTLLASPIVAAAVALTGKITDPRTIK